MRLVRILIVFTLAAAVAQSAMVKSAKKIVLGETPVRVNVYENAGASVTFFAPHYNEQIGLNLAKEFIQKKGGRLVEIESYDDRGRPSRHLNFKSAAKLQSNQCALDDRSLSVNAAQNEIRYICLEADGSSGLPRQRQMLEAVYALLFEQK